MERKGGAVASRQTPVMAWLDLEMTGLCPNECAIVELALILTGPDLVPLAPPLELVVWQPDSVLERMAPFVRQMHQKSGLLERIRRSEVAVADAEQEALRLLSQHAPYRTARLCGNSISQDRRFLAAYMPAFENYLHYRMVDVSTLKELANWWSGYRFRKGDEGRHTALYDVQQSIAELAAYRENVWRAPGSDAKG